jgi:hypothetical protein
VSDQPDPSDPTRWLEAERDASPAARASSSASSSRHRSPAGRRNAGVAIADLPVTTAAFFEADTHVRREAAAQRRGPTAAATNSRTPATSSSPASPPSRATSAMSSRSCVPSPTSTLGLPPTHVAESLTWVHPRRCPRRSARRSSSSASRVRATVLRSDRRLGVARRARGHRAWSATTTRPTCSRSILLTGLYTGRALGRGSRQPRPHRALLRAHRRPRGGARPSCHLLRDRAASGRRLTGSEAARRGAGGGRTGQALSAGRSSPTSARRRSTPSSGPDETSRSPAARTRLPRGR